MAFPILGNPKPQFSDSSGSPLASGTLAVLDPADDTDKASYPTYDDAEAATNANVNPVVLNSRGEPPNGLWGLDGEDYKLVLKDSAGATVWTSDDVTLSGVAFAEGDVRKYGAVLDGSTDDSAAWIAAEAAATAGKGVVFVPASASGMAISTGVSSVNNVVFEPGAFLLYTGSTEEAALTLGVVTTNTSKKTHKNIAVRRNTLADWTNEANIGVRCLNLIACNTEIFRSERFTLGLLVEGNDWGNGYNKYHLGTLQDNKVALKLLTAETSLTQGYCNENNFYGGRLTNFTGGNDSLDRWGVVMDSTRVTKSEPNSNRFWGTCFELNASGASGVCRPIHINYGLYNRFVHVRDENNDAPFMECENNAEWNRAETTNSSVSAVRNDGDHANNFVMPERRFPLQRQTAYWQSPSLARASNEYDGSNSVYVPGCSMRNSSNGNQNLAINSITVDDDYLDVPSSRGVGVMVDTTYMKRFVFRHDSESGRGPRVVVIPYDTNAAQLTTDVSYVSGSNAAGFAHTSNSGGAYITSALTQGNDVFVNVSSDVHFMWIGCFGAASSCRIRSFGIHAVDEGSMSVFQGYLDANSDPFPNDNLNYATAAPANATAGPNYPAGKRLHKFNHSTGVSPGWVCITQGLGGTAAFETEGVTA